MSVIEVEFESDVVVAFAVVVDVGCSAGESVSPTTEAVVDDTDDGTACCSLSTVVMGNADVDATGAGAITGGAFDVDVPGREDLF